MGEFCPDCGYENKDAARFCSYCGCSMITGEAVKETILDNRYRIVSTLGEGGMGRVYKAEHIKLGRLFAIKEMDDIRFDGNEEKEEARLKFEKEADILSRLHHRGIPEVTDFFTLNESYTIVYSPGNRVIKSRNRHFLVMSFIEGRDLGNIMKDRKYKAVGEDDAVEWLNQILDILEYLHSQKPPVIYRDMKPSNIMLSDKNEIFLIDFGIAKLFQPQRKGTLIGTPGYAAPEQYKGISDRRSDIYSLGATYHFLLTGIDPEKDTSSLFQFRNISQVNLTISSGLEKLVMSMLELDSSLRPQSIKEIRNALNGMDEENSLSLTGDEDIDALLKGAEYYFKRKKYKTARLYYREIAEKIERQLRGAGQFLQEVILGNSPANDVEKRSLYLHAGDAWYRAGICNNILKDVSSALRCFDNARDIYVEFDDEIHLADTDFNLGKLNLIRKDYEQGINYLKSASLFYEKEKNYKNLADTLYELALISRELDIKPDAEEYFLGATEAYKKSNDPIRYAIVLYDLGRLYYESEYFQNAREYFELAVQELDKLSMDRELADSYFKLGNIHMELENPKVSVEYFQKSLLLFRKLNNKKMEADTFMNLGTAYEDMEETEEAEKYYLSALKMFENEKDYKGMADLLYNLGSMDYEENKYNDALKYFEESNKYYNILRDMENQGNSLYKIARIHWKQERTEDACRFFLKARECYGRSYNGKKVEEIDEILFLLK